MNTRLLVLFLGCAATAASACVPVNIGPGSQNEIRVHTGEPADKVLPKVLTAFMDNSLPVSSSQGDIVEAKLSREMGMVAQYEIVARAIVIPVDSGTDVRLYGEETTYSTTLPKGSTLRIGASNNGRAARTWASLLKVAQAIQPDSSRRRIADGR